MLSGLLVGLPVVMVDAIGAKTGRVRRIPIMVLRRMGGAQQNECAASGIP
ncbi:MAG: hypothetical protein WBN82_12875 [Porticoccaceae bacterium]